VTQFKSHELPNRSAGHQPDLHTLKEEVTHENR
jgi:hypothetical protein